MVLFYKKKKLQGTLTFLKFQKQVLEHLLFDITAHEQSYESKDLRLAEHHILHPVPASKISQKICCLIGVSMEGHLFLMPHVSMTTGSLQLPLFRNVPHSLQLLILFNSLGTKRIMWGGLFEESIYNIYIFSLAYGLSK